jgi:hypothetical protein
MRQSIKHVIREESLLSDARLGIKVFITRTYGVGMGWDGPPSSKVFLAKVITWLGLAFRHVRTYIRGDDVCLNASLLGLLP